MEMKYLARFLPEYNVQAQSIIFVVGRHESGLRQFHGHSHPLIQAMAW